MTMTRRDYEMLAAVIAQERANPANDHTLERCAIDSVTAAIARALAADNPRFNTRRFLAAATAGGETLLLAEDPPPGPLDAPDEVDL